MVSRYVNDRRVQRHPDGSWMVFSRDAKFNVQVRGDTADAYDAHGRYLLHASMRPFDAVVESLIGPPQ